MALSAERNTPQREWVDGRSAVASGATIHRGGLVMLNASREATPGAVATGQTAAGRAETGTVQDAAAVTVRRGTFRWKNSASGDAITAADWGKTVYIVDDEMVAKTNGTSTRSVAGICRGWMPWVCGSRPDRGAGCRDARGVDRGAARGASPRGHGARARASLACGRDFHRGAARAP
jgi:hypothetical protein